MEWVCGMLAAAVLALFWSLSDAWKRLSILERGFNRHREAPSRLGHNDAGIATLYWEDWGRVWDSIHSKQDKPLLRRSTDKKPEGCEGCCKPKGGKK